MSSATSIEPSSAASSAPAFVPAQRPSLPKTSYLALVAGRVFRIFALVYHETIGWVYRTLFPNTNWNELSVEGEEQRTLLVDRNVLYRPRSEDEHVQAVYEEGKGHIQRVTHDFVERHVITPLRSDRRGEIVRGTTGQLRRHLARKQTTSFFASPAEKFFDEWSVGTPFSEEMTTLLNWVRQDVEEATLFLISEMDAPAAEETFSDWIDTHNFTQSFAPEFREAREWVVSDTTDSLFKDVKNHLISERYNPEKLTNVLGWFGTPEYGPSEEFSEDPEGYKEVFKAVYSVFFQYQRAHLFPLHRWLEGGELFLEEEENLNPDLVKKRFLNAFHILFSEQVDRSLDRLDFVLGDGLPDLLQETIETNQTLISEYVLSRISDLLGEVNFSDLLLHTCGLLDDHSEAVSNAEQVEHRKREGLGELAKSTNRQRIRDVCKNAARKADREDLLEAIEQRFEARSLARVFERAVRGESPENPDALERFLQKYLKAYAREMTYDEFTTYQNPEGSKICHHTIAGHIRAKHDVYSVAARHEIIHTQTIASTLFDLALPELTLVEEGGDQQVKIPSIEFLISQFTFPDEVNSLLNDTLQIVTSVMPASVRKILDNLAERAEASDYSQLVKDSFIEGVRELIVGRIAESIHLGFKQVSDPERLGEAVVQRILPLLSSKLFRMQGKNTLKSHFSSLFAEAFLRLLHPPTEENRAEEETKEAIRLEIAEALFAKMQEEANLATEELAEHTPNDLLSLVRRQEAKLEGTTNLDEINRRARLNADPITTSHTVFGSLAKKLLLDHGNINSGLFHTAYPLIEDALSQLISSGVGSEEYLRKIALETLTERLRLAPRSHEQEEEEKTFEQEVGKVSRLAHDLIFSSIRSIRKEDERQNFVQRAACGLSYQFTNTFTAHVLGRDERKIAETITHVFNSLFSKNIYNRSLIAQIADLVTSEISRAAGRIDETYPERVVQVDTLPLLIPQTANGELPRV